MDNIGLLFDRFAVAYQHSLYAIKREQEKIERERRASREQAKKQFDKERSRTATLAANSLMANMHNDVERRICPRPALAQARNDIRDDEFQDSRTNGCRHNITACDCFGSRFLIIAVDGCDVLDHNVLVSFARHIADRVLMLFLQSLHNRLRHVDERHLVARLAECRTDKAAANVAAAIHNCLFHSDLTLLLISCRTTHIALTIL